MVSTLEGQVTIFKKKYFLTVLITYMDQILNFMSEKIEDGNIFKSANLHKQRNIGFHLQQRGIIGFLKLCSSVIFNKSECTLIITNFFRIWPYFTPEEEKVESKLLTK